MGGVAAGQDVKEGPCLVGRQSDAKLERQQVQSVLAEAGAMTRPEEFVGCFVGPAETLRLESESVSVVDPPAHLTLTADGVAELEHTHVSRPAEPGRTRTISRWCVGLWAVTNGGDQVVVLLDGMAEHATEPLAHQAMRSGALRTTPPKRLHDSQHAPREVRRRALE